MSKTSNRCELRPSDRKRSVVMPRTSTGCSFHLVRTVRLSSHVAYRYSSCRIQKKNESWHARDSKVSIKLEMDCSPTGTGIQIMRTMPANDTNTKPPTFSHAHYRKERIVPYLTHSSNTTTVHYRTRIWSTWKRTLHRRKSGCNRCMPRAIDCRRST